jgi:hypothetical protein
MVTTSAGLRSLQNLQYRRDSPGPDPLREFGTGLIDPTPSAGAKFCTAITYGHRR